MIKRQAVVRHPEYPQWGRGHVIRAGKRLTRVFFVWGGRRNLPVGESLELARPSALEAKLFELCGECSPQAWARGHHSLYAVALDPAVLKVRAFKEKNPGGAASGCLYIGVTGLPPETRFERHLEGTQSARLVKKYGVRLRMDLVEGFSKLPWKVAAAMEPKVAAWLRAQGFGVWQN